LTFGNQTVGTTSASQAITLTNESGGSTVTITSLPSPAQIPPTSRRPQLRHVGAAKAELHHYRDLYSHCDWCAQRNGVSSRQRGIEPANCGIERYGTSNVTVTPMALTFTAQSCRLTSNPQVVTLKNGGATTLTVSSIAFSGTNPGDFAQTNTCGTSVAGGASCTISVTFKPTNIQPSLGDVNHYRQRRHSDSIDCWNGHSSVDFTKRASPLQRKPLGLPALRKLSPSRMPAAAVTITITSIKLPEQTDRLRADQHLRTSVLPLKELHDLGNL